MELSPDGRTPTVAALAAAAWRPAPTGALDGARRIDARRCVSFLTIEHKGPIPRGLRPLIGNRIYGCDDCLAVCPWNRFAKAAAEIKLRGRADLAEPRLVELAALDDAAFRGRFSGSPVKRIGRGRFVRNVLVALGNGDAAGAGAVTARLGDADPLVRGAAVGGRRGCWRRMNSPP
jgi:epoxyqueuosine reductase